MALGNGSGVIVFLTAKTGANRGAVSEKAAFDVPLFKYS
jgi:hypothetical protein